MIPEKWFFKGPNPRRSFRSQRKDATWNWFNNRFRKDYSFLEIYAYCSEGQSFVIGNELDKFLSAGFQEISYDDFIKYILNEEPYELPIIKEDMTYLKELLEKIGAI